MVAAQLFDRLEPIVSAQGYDLEDVALTPAGKRRMVRVTIDKDGGVTLDECADVSRAVSVALDSSDDVLGKQPYTLEVSSPGVSRPLTLPRHWRRSLSRLVKVTLTDSTVVTGRLTAADEAGAALDVDGDLRDIAYADVAKAVVQVELNRPAHDDEGDG